MNGSIIRCLGSKIIKYRSLSTPVYIPHFHERRPHISRMPFVPDHRNGFFFPARSPLSATVVLRLAEVYHRRTTIAHGGSDFTSYFLSFDHSGGKFTAEDKEDDRLDREGMISSPLLI